MNSFLYTVIVVIWGTTWLAIYFQLGEVPVDVSVFYRFSLAALLLFPVLKLFGKLQKTNGSDHLFMILQGVCLFSLNFLCFYTATQYIASGLVSVIFSLATCFNALNNRVLFGEKISASILVAACLGFAGLVLLFWPQLEQQSSAVETISGIGLATFGTYLFSLGNMVSKRHSMKGLAPLTTNAYAMVYGSLILAAILILKGQPLVWDSRESYLVSLLYLSIFGSIIGFTTYLSLVGRIGPNRAAYATVMFPVVALVLSSWFEDYQWQLSSVIGLMLTLLGNLVINGGSLKALKSRFA